MTYYDSIAKGYSDLHSEEQLAKVRVIKRILDVGETDLMLDIGCGPYFGDFPCRVIGIDSSYELLKQARIPGVLGYAEQLPFKNHSFDIVISVTALHNFNNPENALIEACRVGKGRFVFTLLKKSKKYALIEQSIKSLFTVEQVVDERFYSIFFLTTKYK